MADSYLKAMKQGNFPLALTLLDRELGIDPNDPKLLFNFAVCCFQTQNFSKAKQILYDILEKFPGFIEEARIYRLVAFCLIEERKWDEVEIVIRGRLELYPNDVQLLSFLAHVFEHTHRLDESIEVHRTILELSPNYANSLNSLGYLLALKESRSPEETKEAIDCLRKVLELFPDNPTYLDSFGYLLQQMGKEEDALKAFRKGLQRNPSDPVLLERLKSFG